MKSQSVCPSCKTVLEFDRAAFSVVKCPKCGYQGVTADFKEIKKQPESAKTEIITGNLSGNNLCKPGKLELLESSAQWMGKERIVNLQPGINTLGRQSPNATSNVQLPTTDSYMGKNHATIEVIMKTDGCFEHRLSDRRSKNGTFHNGDRLEDDDAIKLVSGDVIRMGQTVLKFIAG